MSRLSEYSKFDHIDSDEEGSNRDAPFSSAVNRDQGVGATAHNNAVSIDAATPLLSQGSTKKSTVNDGRYIFEYGGQKIYEWEQSLEEVTIYIDAPPQVPSAAYIVVNILPTRLQVGLKDHDRFFIDEFTFDKVKTNESSWFLDDGVITIILSKCFRGQTWEGVLRGNASEQQGGGSSGETINETVDPLTKQEMQRTLMLERFQEENPGFDFRDATFNGEVPDPRTFMGGVGYDH
mmetsp:Transcript_6197/g.12652  ORF Transcript_6197/g.12652 Transcript_6197/m.12652 type:complete len:235 (-) Transcript_6197:1249-1953(-)